MKISVSVLGTGKYQKLKYRIGQLLEKVVLVHP